MSLQHPFALELSELQEVLNREKAQTAEEGNSSPPEEDATTERLAEEGGNEPGPPDFTTLAVGEEGGMQPPQLPPPPDFPDPTGILAEQGGFIAEPLPPTASPVVGEEEDELPPPLLEGEATTERLAEEGGMEPRDLPPPPDFPEPTGILAEQGGVVISDPLPLATTQAVGEEGGGFTEVLAEQGEGVATTMAIGEEGGIVTRADGEDGDTVVTFAEGEDGEIREFDEPEATTLAVGEEGGDVQIAEVETLAGTPDNGSLEAITDAFGEPGGFNEVAYGELYPPLIDAVNSGVVPSLLDHYEAFGQFEPERIGIFDGNFTPDIVTAFGNNTIISGVPILGYDPIVGDFIFGGNGRGEKDVLIGQSDPNATELFILGDSKVQPYSFYATLGDEDLDDYAVIQNFDVGSDRIQLSGFVEDYNFEVVNNSTYISKTTDGDLVAIVENVSNIQDATLIFEGY